jgi:hypothetical protein
MSGGPMEEGTAQQLYEIPINAAYSITDKRHVVVLGDDNTIETYVGRTIQVSPYGILTQRGDTVCLFPWHRVIVLAYHKRDENMNRSVGNWVA